MTDITTLSDDAEIPNRQILPEVMIEGAIVESSPVTLPTSGDEVLAELQNTTKDIDTKDEDDQSILSAVDDAKESTEVEDLEPLEPTSARDPPNATSAPRATSSSAESDDEDIIIRPRSRSKRSSIKNDEEDPVSKRNKMKANDTSPVIDEKTNTEVVPLKTLSNDDEDDEGNTKVDQDGALIGDRTYTTKAFRLPSRGDTYYFLATEIARISGYRDSYLLFNKNRNLKKLMTTEGEKAYLIQNELLPYSYRNRQIGVVKALSIYKTFGAKVVFKGKRVQDDYFAQRARDAGFTEEDFANEEDRPVEDRLFAQAEAQRRLDTEAEQAIANNAKSAIDYNAMLNGQRKAREIARRQHFLSCLTTTTANKVSSI